MKVDVGALAAVNALAHEGATHAASSLERLTGLSPTVEATAVELLRREDALATLRGRELVGVTTRFDGSLSGTALLVFDRPNARALVDHLPIDVDGTDPLAAAMPEVGNILLSGFVDGWADHLGERIDQQPPSYVAGDAETVLPDGPAGDAFTVTSRLESGGTVADASVFLFPDREPFGAVLESAFDDDSVPIPLEKLQAFTRMTAAGAEQAGENVTMMTGVETTVDVSRIRFLPVEALPSRLGDDRYVGTVVELTGLPQGYLLVLFDPESAASVAEAMGAGSTDGELGEMGESAVEELGNVTSSGFIDGWANVLGASNQHTPPEFVDDYGAAIVDPVVASLAADQEFAFTFEATVRTVDESVTCTILAVPNEEDFHSAVAQLSLADGDLEGRMRADPEELF